MAAPLGSQMHLSYDGNHVESNHTGLYRNHWPVTMEPRTKKLWDFIDFSADSEYRSRAHSPKALIFKQNLLS